MRRILFLSLVFIGFITASFGQSANRTEGCVGLQVDFTGPSGYSAYYWDFVEGNGSSTDKDPSYTFAAAGEYTVVLYEGVGGTKIGDIKISAYAKPVISIATDSATIGCAPFVVNFVPTITHDPAIAIEGYEWLFGDDITSNLEKPIHTYIGPITDSGIGTATDDFDITLNLMTNKYNCDVEYFEEDYVTADKLKVVFDASTTSECEAPVDIKFINATNDIDGNIYTWDFGNGETFNGYDPGSINFSEEGVYDVVLRVQTKNGCDKKDSIKINIGSPIIIIDPEVGCLNAFINFNNTSPDLNGYNWTFGEGANESSSNLRFPEVKYNTPGIKTITMEIDNGMCASDTTFTIEIIDINPNFTLDDPTITCADPAFFNVEADEKGYIEYIWKSDSTELIIPMDPTTSFTYDDPTRDSLYWHNRDTFNIKLIVTTEEGCIDSSYQFFYIYKPNAHFAPSVAQGCAPLAVMFSDSCKSFEEIVKYTYYYGDGQSQEFTSDQPNEHTYTNPGEYYVKLVIETSSGCIDTSAGAWIKVGEPITPDFSIDKTEICLGEEITVDFNNMDDRIDAVHLTTDDYRFDHCWKSNVATHTFNTLPGVYPVTGIVDYNGCVTTVSGGNIIVNGAKADIGYMVDCNATHDIMFASESTNATDITWTTDNTTYTDTVFVHHYDTTGSYEVVLEAFDATSGCPSTYDTTTVYVKDIKAVFDIPEHVCDNVEYTVDGSGSIDVDVDCNKGYLWEFPVSTKYPSRPIETSEDNIPVFYPSDSIGPTKQFITLIVEDINGCKDTLVKETLSYGIEPEFELDKLTFCLPVELNTINTTMSDTTITSWTWNNGSEDFNTIYELDESNTPNETEHYFELKMEDELGCKDSVWLILEYYKPESQIIPNKDKFCVGEELIFIAQDFTEQGSQLDFNWNLEGIGNYQGQDHTVNMESAGVYNLNLYFEEIDSGCKDTLDMEIIVIDHPIADFTTDKNLDDVQCSPASINFTNTSTMNDYVQVKWLFETIGKKSYSESPSHTFTRGDHTATVIANPVGFSCPDSLTKSFTVIEPQGKIVADKDSICIGESITFTITDTIDVDRYTWNFGFGEEVVNTSPVTYEYLESKDSLSVKLYLDNDEYGCNEIDTLNITIFDTNEYLMPNIFSPNGDDENDYFRPFTLSKNDSLAIPSITELKIYNRYGNLVYDNQNTDEGWDGMFNGDEAPAGVYGYYMIMKILGCPEFKQQGNVTILR